MKGKNLLILVFLMSMMNAGVTGAQTLIHYWNFNDNSTVDNLLQPNTSIIQGASINHIVGGISEIALNGTGQNFDLENLNAQNGDPAGTHLRFNDPIGGELEFSLPTTGFINPIVQFSTRRSGSGAGLQYWSYSLDNGLFYITFDTIAPNDGDPGLVTFDFSDVDFADNNAEFKLKVSFAAGSGGLVGNNRFDNFTLNASVLPSISLIHYWNFNDNSSENALLTPSYTTVNGAAISVNSVGISVIDLNGTGQNFDTQNLNAQFGDPSGTHLRYNDPIGSALEFQVPTSGHSDIKVQFATRRSGQGAGKQTWLASFDGASNFEIIDSVFPNNGDPLLTELDLSGYPQANDNQNLLLRVEFEQGPGGTGGNNRFDNLTVSGISSGGDTQVPVVSFSPANNSTLVPTDVHPVISFNEPIQIAGSGDTINSENALDIFYLRIGAPDGQDIAYSADIQGNSIVLTPENALLNDQVYYIGLKANSISDFSNNVIDAEINAAFTTISLQTEFEAGDMVIVAYRMNATATEDEIGLLTFKDILPGTIVRITDSKYTQNAQPQCNGGILWTSPSNECIPAGTVISIQPDAGIASPGTITGSTFGLSSGGDQVIIYTGTADNPSYITALSSNEWLTQNTSCSGSNSMIPAGLEDGLNAINLSTAPGAVNNNSVNSYYTATQTGTKEELQASILNPVNWISEGAGTAAQEWPEWVFPGPPAVIDASLLDPYTIQLIFNTELSIGSVLGTDNYSGIEGLLSIGLSDTQSGNDTIKLSYNEPFMGNQTYTLVVSGIENEDGIVMSCPFNFTFSYNTSITAESNFIVVEENHGILEIRLLIENPSIASFDLNILPPAFNTSDAADYEFESQTISITPDSGNEVVIQINITDDQDEEQHAEYFNLIISNLTGTSLSGDSLITIYIRDNDRLAPQPTQDVELHYVGSFDPSGSNNSTCEVVAFDPESKRLFSTSAISNVLDIIDFSNPSSPTTIKSIDMTPYGGLTSVASQNGYIAVASPNEAAEIPGSVVFFDIDGEFLSQVTVGVLPDMIVFSPDGSKVMTANEGQPNSDYSVDPEGSVSIIDITAGIETLSNAQVQTLEFTSFNTSESELINAGVRKTKKESTLSQDLEPEYISIDIDSKTAWVSCQENNAIAEINLETEEIVKIWAMGTKNLMLPGNGIDASDNNSEILISNWPIHAYFIPDGIASYNVGGKNYIITANEGDEKEYDGLNERTSVGAGSYILNPENYPQSSMLKKSYNLGRMRVTNLNGDSNGNGDYDQIHCLGTRSFSIFDAENGELVFDSGDDMEFYISQHPDFSKIFNADHEENTPKARSRSKGPEPEGVSMATLSDKNYAFVSLERVGGVMIYDVTNPAEPIFVDYSNTRSTSVYEGDNGAETSVFIPSITSPDTKPYLIIANEISGTLTIYEVIDNNPVSVNNSEGKTIRSLNVFPNPATKSSLVYLNRIADISVYDLKGNIVFHGENVSILDLNNWLPGTYIIQSTDGASAKLIVAE
ncbi:MAG: choice-of-anchor I family protein [Saprospiraceae bacterium]|nr:choice-of-anchor I family protein [Saprospiraceae bacterium]